MVRRIPCSDESYLRLSSVEPSSITPYSTASQRLSFSTSAVAAHGGDGGLRGPVLQDVAGVLDDFSDSESDYETIKDTGCCFKHTLCYIMFYD